MASSIHNSVEKQDIFQSKYSLCDIFKQIIDGKPLEVDVQNITCILKDNLALEIDKLKRRLKCILPYMFVHFIKVWPGWQKITKYFGKEISFENWFAKFKQYLIIKVTVFIKNCEVNNLIDDDCHVINKEVQTAPREAKEDAPFILEIRGPPKLLNSLIFCEGAEGNAVLREYKINSLLWSEMLTIRQLMNWPFIELEFKTTELNFKRTNEHEYKRYLTFSSDKILFNKTDSAIEDIEIINEQITRKAYTLNTIKEYCRLYIIVLRKYQKLLLWTNRYLEQIEKILEDFILDITDINLGSIATNSSVLFNIGNAAYARNKSIKTSEDALCLMDSITPRMRLSLIDFSAVNPEDMNEPFPKLQKLFNNADNQSIKQIIPTVTFRCTYCKETFNSHFDTWRHLRGTHNMEQPVICFTCKQQFKFTDLPAHRWRHNCI